MALVGTWQDRIVQWHRRTFGEPQMPLTALLLAEEVGELCRATLKREQGIRGTDKEWREEQQKEAADVFIGLCSFAEAAGFDLNDAIAQRWVTVQQRTAQTMAEKRLPDSD
jgi:NTP pyrophosphatase (non-canonical NTP hydrolase)